MRPDLNPIESLWIDLKTAVRKHPSILGELKKFACRVVGQTAKIERENLIAVLLTKGYVTKY